MKNIALRLMYDGTNYHGWQLQKNGISVQEVIQNALSELTGENISVTGCSRTDAGVHAFDYVLNFMSDTNIPLEKLPYAINNRLNNDICVKKAIEVGMDFNARFSNDGKRYVYRIWNGRIRNPFYMGYSWHFPYKLDIETMKKAAAYFEGTYDFSAFMASGGSQNTTVRTIRNCFVEANGELIEITVEADAFLYNMVRIIVGTLANVGLSKIKADEILSIIKSGDRKNSGPTAPPEGLFLKKVYYKGGLIGEEK